MSKIDLNPSEIVFIANILDASPSLPGFKLGNAVIAVEILKKLLPYLPKEEKKGN